MSKLRKWIRESVLRVFTVKPLERMLLQVVRGTKYQGFWTRFVPYPSLYAFNSMRSVNRKGINYSLDLSCLMQWYVYWDFRSKDRQQLYSLVKPGDVVFDIGTNIGETLLNFAKLATDKGFVYGFEPDDENYRNVIKNISLNDFKHVHVFKKAVSEKKDSVKLFCVDSNNRGMNRILDYELEKDSPYVIVETDTLDNIVRDSKIERIDLIKIDIEGYEMHALLGSKETLRKYRPKLFIEVGYQRLLDNHSSPSELIRLLEGLDYEVFHAETDKRITPEYDFSYLRDGSLDVYAIAK